MINKIKKLFQPKQRDFWKHIADAKVNKNNPDYNLVKQGFIFSEFKVFIKKNLMLHMTFKFSK